MINIYRVTFFSSMLGVACDDFIILIVDTDTKRIVRSFTGHSNRITDMVSQIPILHSTSLIPIPSRPSVLIPDGSSVLEWTAASERGTCQVEGKTQSLYKYTSSLVIPRLYP